MGRYHAAEGSLTVSCIAPGDSRGSNKEMCLTTYTKIGNTVQQYKLQSETFTDTSGMKQSKGRERGMQEMYSVRQYAQYSTTEQYGVLSGKGESGKEKETLPAAFSLAFLSASISDDGGANMAADSTQAGTGSMESSHDIILHYLTVHIQTMK